MPSNAADNQSLGNLTVGWLVKFMRQQQRLFPVKFVDVFKTDTLTVEKKLIVTDEVEFSAFGTVRFFGDQAQPAFTNGWVAYGSPYRSPGFTKTAEGIVLLQGVIKLGAVGSSAATLPPGYRPSAALTLGTFSNGSFGRVDIGSDGAITPQSPSSNLSVVLDGIWFTTS